MCANDALQQTPLETFVSRLETAVDRAKPFGDVLLLTASGITSTSPLAIPISAYRDAMRDVAIDRGVAFLDAAAKLGGDWATANAGGMMADSTHPNRYGQQAIATIVIDALLT